MARDAKLVPYYQNALRCDEHDTKITLMPLSRAIDASLQSGRALNTDIIGPCCVSDNGHWAHAPCMDHPTALAAGLR